MSGFTGIGGIGVIATRDEKFRAELHELAMQQRELGNTEMRIAAARMFEKMKLPAQGVAILVMNMDDYLTADEIAERERMP